MTNTIQNPNCKSDTKIANHMHRHFVSQRSNPNIQSRKFWTPNKVFTNIKSLKDSFVVEMAIPGYNKESVNITIDNSTIKISGKKDVAGEKFILREYHLDQFERVFALPENVDDASIQATIEDGILRITMQVIPAKQARIINIY